MIGKSRYKNLFSESAFGVRSDIETYIEWFHEKHHEISYEKVLVAGASRYRSRISSKNDLLRIWL